MSSQGSSTQSQDESIALHEKYEKVFLWESLKELEKDYNFKKLQDCIKFLGLLQGFVAKATSLNGYNSETYAFTDNKQKEKENFLKVIRHPYIREKDKFSSDEERGESFQTLKDLFEELLVSDVKKWVECIQSPPPNFVPKVDFIVDEGNIPNWEALLNKYESHSDYQAAIMRLAVISNSVYSEIKSTPQPMNENSQRVCLHHTAMNVSFRWLLEYLFTQRPIPPPVNRSKRHRRKKVKSSIQKSYKSIRYDGDKEDERYLEIERLFIETTNTSVKDDKLYQAWQSFSSQGDIHIEITRGSVLPYSPLYFCVIYGSTKIHEFFSDSADTFTFKCDGNQAYSSNVPEKAFDQLNTLINEKKTYEQCCEDKIRNLFESYKILCDLFARIRKSSKVDTSSPTEETAGPTAYNSASGSDIGSVLSGCTDTISFGEFYVRLALRSPRSVTLGNPQLRGIFFVSK